MHTCQRFLSRTAVFGVIFVIALMSRSSSLSAAEPGQFIAKMYSEVLGRIPDQGGWRNYVNYFNSNGCYESSLRAVAFAFLNDSVIASFGYSNAQKLLILYRAAWNRDPDPNGYYFYLNQLNSGVAFNDVVTTFLYDATFTNLVSSMCGGTEFGNYHFGAGQPLAIPTPGLGDFHGGTGAQLQQLLNGGGTIRLDQGALVTLTSPLIIPAGVTLTTAGSVSQYSYAKFGRLVRGSNFGDAMVKMGSGSTVSYVWIDGQRNNLANSPGEMNVQIVGGTNVSLNNSRIVNPTGFTHVQTFPTGGGLPCTQYIGQNVLTGYGSDHLDGSGTADGFTISCDGSTIDSNQIIDATDVSIVLFKATPAVQRSVISNNLILNAGNSSWAALATSNSPDPAPVGAATSLYTVAPCRVVDTRGSAGTNGGPALAANSDRTFEMLGQCGIPASAKAVSLNVTVTGATVGGSLALYPGATDDFTGALFTGNLFWTSSTAHVDVGMSVGSREFLYSGYISRAIGASFTGNGTGTEAARTNNGILVSGMLNATVTGNSGTWSFTNGSTCPTAAVAASVAAGWASGNIQLYTDIPFNSCLDHGTPPPPAFVAAASSISYNTTQPARAANGVYLLGPISDGAQLLHLGLGVRCNQPSGTVHVIIDVNGYFQ